MTDRRWPPASVWVVAILNLAAAVYLGLLAFLLGGWFLDDFVASTMSTADWYRIGGWRLARTVAAALVAGAVSYAVSWGILAGVGTPGAKKWALRLAAGLAALVVGAGVAGVVDFVVTRPWI